MVYLRGLRGGRGGKNFFYTTLEVEFAGDESLWRSCEGERGGSSGNSPRNSTLDAVERAGDTGLRPSAGDDTGE